MTVQQREIWSSQEVDVLIDEYIKRKNYLEGAFSSTVTKQGKLEKWQEICTILKNVCPNQPSRNEKQVRKKIDNLICLTKKEIVKEKQSLGRTGGGPQYVMKPLFVAKSKRTRSIKLGFLPY